MFTGTNSFFSHQCFEWLAFLQTSAFRLNILVCQTSAITKKGLLFISAQGFLKLVSPLIEVQW